MGKLRNRRFPVRYVTNHQRVNSQYIHFITMIAIRSWDSSDIMGSSKSWIYPIHSVVV